MRAESFLRSPSSSAPAARRPFSSAGPASMRPEDGGAGRAALCRALRRLPWRADLGGQANWHQRRPDGRLPAPPHDETGHTWHHPAAQLFALTKRGPAALVGGGYQSDMPAYEGVLNDAEIWAVLSYIKSRWPDEVRARHDQLSAQ